MGICGPVLNYDGCKNQSCWGRLGRGSPWFVPYKIITFVRLPHFLSLRTSVHPISHGSWYPVPPSFNRKRTWATSSWTSWGLPSRYEGPSFFGEGHGRDLNFSLRSSCISQNGVMPYSESGVGLEHEGVSLWRWCLFVNVLAGSNPFGDDILKIRVTNGWDRISTFVP